MIDVERANVATVIAAARASGVLLGTAGAKRIRAVTHLDVDRAAVVRAAEVIAEAVAKA